jgi:hypothetical protein
MELRCAPVHILAPNRIAFNAIYCTVAHAICRSGPAIPPPGTVRVGAPWRRQMQQFDSPGEGFPQVASGKHRRNRAAAGVRPKSGHRRHRGRPLGRVNGWNGLHANKLRCVAASLRARRRMLVAVVVAHRHVALAQLPPTSTSISSPQSHARFFGRVVCTTKAANLLSGPALIPSIIEPQALSVAVASRG